MEWSDVSWGEATRNTHNSTQYLTPGMKLVRVALDPGARAEFV